MWPPPPLHNHETVEAHNTRGTAGAVVGGSPSPLTEPRPHSRVSRDNHHRAGVATAVCRVFVPPPRIGALKHGLTSSAGRETIRLITCVQDCNLNVV